MPFGPVTGSAGCFDFLLGLTVLSSVGSLRRPSLGLDTLGDTASDRVGLRDRLEVVMLRSVLRLCPAGDRKSVSSQAMRTSRRDRWELRLK